MGDGAPANARRPTRRGFTDLVAAHVDVWRYPGPENQRPSDLATKTRMTKQALNYLLGQLEELDT